MRDLPPTHNILAAPTHKTGPVTPALITRSLAPRPPRSTKYQISVAAEQSSAAVAFKAPVSGWYGSGAVSGPGQHMVQPACCINGYYNN